jgi:hypothetical protein
VFWALVGAAIAILFVGAIVYFILAQPPELPAYARPTGAREIMNEIESCEMTDDFGPYYRQLAFESDRPWADIRDEITEKFAAHGWTKAAWNDDGFWEYAPSGNLRIFFETGESARFTLLRHRKTARLPTVVGVSVSDCPGP